MADSIHVKLPDGSVKEVPKGTTALDIAKSISPRLADAALVAKINGDLIDLTRPLEKDTDLRLLTDRDPEALEVYRHSTAHLLAAAVLELFPETKLGIGPPIETGFYYDFHRATPFTPDDLEKIEKKMWEIGARPALRARVSAAQGRRAGEVQARRRLDEVPVHRADHQARREASRVHAGPHFIDFCRGPHVPSTAKIKAFKLLSIAGAYWKGDEKNTQLQRIYGTAFFSQEGPRRVPQASSKKPRSATIASWARSSTCSASRSWPGRA